MSNNLTLFQAGWYSKCKVNNEDALWLESTDKDWKPETLEINVRWYSEEEINKQDCTIVI